MTNPILILVSGYKKEREEFNMKIVKCDKCKKEIPANTKYYGITVVPSSYEIEDRNTTIYNQDFIMSEEREYCEECYTRIFRLHIG